jgi:hypothetical protein
MTIIKAGTTLPTGFVVTSDNTGTLQFKTGSNGITALDISGDQVVTISGVSKLSIPGGLPGQVLATDGEGNLSWVNGSDGGNEITLRAFKYIATAGQATFSGDDSEGRALLYSANNIIVFVNGLHTTDFLASDGVSIVFPIGQPLGTIVEIISYEPFKKADIVPASTGGHFNGSLSVRGSVTITGKFVGDGSVLTNFTSSQITTALGYTPYNITNPSQYTTLSQVSSLGSASKLTTGRTLGITGDLTWTSPVFDGTNSVTATGTLKDTGTAGTYKSVTTDSKGRVISGTNPTTLSEYGITDSQPLDSDLTSIAEISDSGVGLLKKTGPGSWTLDNSAYITNVSTSLGYVPYNSSNPANYLTEATATPLYATKGELTSSIPSGVIVMWFGSTVPAGWKLCNGTNGTPDLRDRFIVGAGASYGTGSIGGFTDTVLPSHTHSLTGTATGPAGEHQHDSGWGEYWGGPFGNTSRYPSTGSGRTDGDNVGWLTSSAGGHSHNINGTIGYAGVSSAGRNLPPYYALAYIMKI